MLKMAVSLLNQGRGNNCQKPENEEMADIGQSEEMKTCEPEMECDTTNVTNII
jgi:hypothetical protein